MWTTDLLRKKFLDFFKNRNHIILPGISVVPENDPTLLFTNSGMVQFKNIFLNGGAKYSRVCTIQRCIRAGGKHNDLDDVGLDNYHHTFFEMLGNWSFGDYFKEEAIKYAYEFLVEELGLDKERLYVTVYEELDKESRTIWQKYFNDSKILSASYKDNFWEMGEYGPCGPCTEIHYDRIGDRDASLLVNKDDPNVIEIWNIVFMEYNRTKNGLEELKIKNVDTGIGFERLLSILMGVNSNYQTDTFQAIIGYIENLCFSNKGYKFNDSKSDTDIAVRVLADHTRCIAVCLNDKVEFASEGVGYVLRRIMRRGMRYALDILKINGGDFSKIVEKASKVLGLDIDIGLIQKEEELFMKALKKGMVMFDKVVKEKKILKGEDIFFLYDTYGFPADLTQLLAREKNVDITMDGFEESKKRSQELSKRNRVYFNINFQFEKTIDFYKYETNCIIGEIKAIVKENEIIEGDEIIENDKIDGIEISLIFDKTCFYSEKGGQIGDKGRINFKDINGDIVGIFNVYDTKNNGGYIFHKGKLKGKITKFAELIYDQKLRTKICVNHSICHILYYFLRKEFKTIQKGSLVDEFKCRFDFEGEKLTEDVIKRVEKRINKFIKENSKKTTVVFSKEEGEKEGLVLEEDGNYEDGIRVISFSVGEDIIRDVCGGTHVFATGEIKKARIISEVGIQANTRRIIIITNERADEAEENANKLLKDVENGQIVTMECLLPLIEYNKIKMLNKINVRNFQKRVIEIITKKTQEFETAIITFKLKHCNKKCLFTYKIKEIIDLNKKDIQKLLSLEVAYLINKKVYGIIQIKFQNYLIFAIYSEDNEKLLKAFFIEFGMKSFRINKNYIFGILNNLEGLFEKIQVIFKQEFKEYI